MVHLDFTFDLAYRTGVFFLSADRNEALLNSFLSLSTILSNKRNLLNPAKAQLADEGETVTLGKVQLGNHHSVPCSVIDQCHAVDVILRNSFVINRPGLNRGRHTIHCMKMVNDRKLLLLLQLSISVSLCCANEFGRGEGRGAGAGERSGGQAHPVAGWRGGREGSGKIAVKRRQK